MRKLNDTHILLFIKFIGFLFLIPILGGLLSTYFVQNNQSDYTYLLSIYGSHNALIFVNICYAFIYLIITTPTTFAIAFILKRFFTFDLNGNKKIIVSIFLGITFFILSFLVFAFLLVAYCGTNNPEIELFPKAIGRSLVFVVPSILSVKYLYKSHYIQKKYKNNQSFTSKDPFR